MCEKVRQMLDCDMVRESLCPAEETARSDWSCVDSLPRPPSSSCRLDFWYDWFRSIASFVFTSQHLGRAVFAQAMDTSKSWLGSVGVVLITALMVYANKTTGRAWVLLRMWVVFVIVDLFVCIVAVKYKCCFLQLLERQGLLMLICIVSTSAMLPCSLCTISKCTISKSGG